MTSGCHRQWILMSHTGACTGSRIAAGIVPASCQSCSRTCDRGRSFPLSLHWHRFVAHGQTACGCGARGVVPATNSAARGRDCMPTWSLPTARRSTLAGVHVGCMHLHSRWKLLAAVHLPCMYSRSRWTLLAAGLHVDCIDSRSRWKVIAGDSCAYCCVPCCAFNVCPFPSLADFLQCLI